ncbi:ice-binding family protein, partial [Methanoculleus sp.]|uniref:ice-binding family protein n=1 Tax=Methanoculleus sp. TaxID=90427 RepID=UPI00345DDA60
MTGTKKHARKMLAKVFTVALICLVAAGTMPGVMGASNVNLGSAANFGVLGASTVTNAGSSQITGDLGVSPGTAVTGFPPGTVSGTIHAGDTEAANAQADALIAYNALRAQAPDTTYAGVTQLNGMTFTPGVYKFEPSANLQVGGTIYLDFMGDNNAVFIFQTDSTLVMMANSRVVALNTSSQTCSPNVYWVVGSSATIDSAEFIGTVIASSDVTMTSAANTPPITTVSGRMIALNGAVTMVDSRIAVCGGTPTPTPTVTPTPTPTVTPTPTPTVTP